MADLDFEMRLDRLFAEPPAFSDSEGFARQVETRLNRGWNVRALAIWSAGIAGGLIGAVQLIGSNILGKAEVMSATEGRALGQGIDGLVRAGSNLSALPIGGEALWMAAALAILALAFGITRAMDQM